MTDSSKRLGYGGSARVDNIQLLITSGTFDNPVSVSYIEAVSLQPVDSSRSRIKHADGTETFSGSIGFDVTEAAMNTLKADRLLSRGFMFHSTIDDGEDSYIMSDCLATSLTMNGAAGGLITASLAFSALEVWAEGSELGRIFSDDEEDQQNVPLAYWQSGNVGVRDWTLTMNQDVTPMYGNQNTMSPHYLLVGLINYSLSVTTYEQIREHSSITILTTGFQLQGNTASRGYSYGGQTELGGYTHNFETAADANAGAGAVIIS